MRVDRAVGAGPPPPSQTKPNQLNPSQTKPNARKMQGINLVFPCISFGESGLFNGLRATWPRVTSELAEQHLRSAPPSHAWARPHFARCLKLTCQAIDT